MLGRNDKCSCGSGKKFKQCCMLKVHSKSDQSSRVKTQPAEIAKAFHVAASHHQAGRLTEAEAIYRQILQHNPQHPPSLHFLGMIAFNVGNYTLAIDLTNQSINADPTDPMFHYNQGIIFSSQGNLSAAVDSYRRAVSLNSKYSDAYYNLGITLIEVYHKRFDINLLTEAEACFRRVLNIKPYAAAYNNLGKTLEYLDRLDEALDSYRLSLNPATDWNAAIKQMTTPMIIHFGNVLKPRYLPETGESDSCRRQKKPSSTPASLSRIAGTLRNLVCPTFGTKNQLKIVLIYPPPWQILSPGEIPQGTPFDPPAEKISLELDIDFQTITYGLLTIAAQALRKGYDVSVHNLSVSPWQEVVSLIAETKADVYGISSFVSNRRGMGAVAALIRKHHPQSHIMAGGPFVTALPQETLKYFSDIDTAVIGEGEETFMELLACIKDGRPTAGVPGTAWRKGRDIITGPLRSRIDNLDALASPFDFFSGNIVMTSRGCPSKCTFCGSINTWGKKLRFQSVASSLDMFKKALARLPLPILVIKDDTFTADRRRAIEICDAIIEHKIDFIWSCDTRVDCLDDELLRKMRQAGCQMVSFGVESGSPEILKSMRKETTPEKVLEATQSARKYGMYVRYYMILLNRGETADTIEQSINLIKAGRPNHYIFSTLTYYPGTEDWEILSKEQGVTPEVFFKNDFYGLSVANNRNEPAQELLSHVMCDVGTVKGFNYTVDERETVVNLLPDLHVVHIELANALLCDGRLEEAEAELNRAEKLNFPIKSIINNQRACISLAKGNVENALVLLESAIQSSSSILLQRNYRKLKAWNEIPVHKRGKCPVLEDSINAVNYL